MAVHSQWFAPEDEGKTEEPSEYKLRKAREEGRVAKSQDLNGSLVYLFCIIVLVFLAPWMLDKFKESMVFFFSHVTDSRVNRGVYYLLFLKYMAYMVLPFAVTGAIAGIASNFIQNRGWIFTTKTIAPKFSKIAPKFGEYFKKTIGSTQGLFNIFKSLLKVAVIVIVSFLFIRSDLDVILMMTKTSQIDIAVGLVAKMAAKILIVSAIFFLPISISDYFIQRREFIRSMKMTKQEVKQEFKEMEGDPLVKGHLEQAQRSLLTQNLPKAVSESDVVITNPTHYAVALKYDVQKADAPMVTAKGEDLTAQNIKRIAKENNIPTIENRPLARGLYTDVEIGAIIPIDYMRAIATIYSQIGWMDENKK